MSLRSGLVAVYMSKLGSWGENIWGYAGRDIAVVPCWWSLYLCVGFFLWRRSCVSSPPAGGGVGSYCASFDDCSAFSAPCPAAGYPSGVPRLADSGWLTSSCGGGLVWVGGVLVQMSCYPTWVSTLCQRSSPFRCFPFGVLRPCRERQHV